MLDKNTVKCLPENNRYHKEAERQPSHYRISCKETQRKRLSSCCHEFFVDDSITRESPNCRYMQILLRRGLTVSSVDSANYVCMAFAILDFSSEYVSKLVLDSWAGITMPEKYLQIAQFQTFNNKRRNIDWFNGNWWSKTN